MDLNVFVYRPIRMRLNISTMSLKFIGWFFSLLSTSAAALRRSASSEGRV